MYNRLFHLLYSVQPTYSVYIADGTGREVIVDYEVDSLEVHAAAHQLRTDQHPDLSRPETLHYVVSLEGKIKKFDGRKMI